jgi:DNA polymerase-1
MNELEDRLHQLLKLPKIGLDIETTGLRPYAANSTIHCAAVGTFDNTVAFAIDHPEGWSGHLTNKVWGIFQDFIAQSGRKICHNLAFEQEWLAYFLDKHLLRKTEWEDTLAMAHTLREVTGTNSLDDLTREYFGFYLKDQSRIDLKNNPFISYPIKEGLRYNAMDTKWTHLLEPSLAEKLAAHPAYVEEYERKVRLCPTLVLTQNKGVPIDFDYVAEMDKKLKLEIKSIEGKLNRCVEVGIYKKRYGGFEPTAPEQVLKLLRDVYKLDVISTGEEVLSELENCPAAPLVLEHRVISKLSSTYITPLVERKMTDPDGNLHTVYTSMRAVSGRLASADPNLQNFPKRKHKEIRGVVAAPPGQIIVAADYGQIEARVFGMATEDRNLVKYLWDGYDIHGYWAGRFMEEHGQIKDRIIAEYAIDGDDDKLIKKKFRDEMKSKWVFAQFFGASIRGCAKSIKVPEEVAQALGREFWDEFNGVLKWQEKLLKKYEKNLYVETLRGRRRRGAMTKNEIINHPIQGTAADIVTLAMNVLSERSEYECNNELQPNLNVHDDLSFFMLENHQERTIPIIAEEMCKHRFDFINVPLIVEVQTGTRWDQLKEIAVYRSNELFNLSGS